MKMRYSGRCIPVSERGNNQEANRAAIKAAEKGYKYIVGFAEHNRNVICVEWFGTNLESVENSRDEVPNGCYSL